MEPNERRAEPRIRTLLTGQIVLSARRASFDCVLRNASPSGARIAVPMLTPVPDEFLLYTPQHDEWQRARRIWRDGNQIGLSLAPDEAEAARRARLKARQRKRKLASLRARAAY
jgi:hypothetical protein